MTSKHTEGESFRDVSALKVKVCGLRDESNIEALLNSATPPFALGFIFYPQSPRFAGETLQPDFMRSVSREVHTVGVFVNASTDTILHAVERYGFYAVQLHGEETPYFCEQLQEGIEERMLNVEIWKAFGIAASEDFASIARYDGIIEKALLDTKGVSRGGNGTRFDWSLLDEYSSTTPFFLSGGIAPEHADDIKKNHHPLLYGVDINSRFETAPALKDVGAVHRFLAELAHH